MVPNRAYPSNELFTRISPQLGDRHFNQPSVVNGYLLLAGNAVHEFWDISDPYSPVRLSELLSPHRSGEAESHQVSYARFPDGSLYLATVSGLGIDLWNIDDVRQPRLLSALELPDISYGDVHNSVWGIAWQGKYIWVGATTSGLYVVDAGDPARPRLVTTLATTALGGVAAGPLFALGNLLVITTPKERSGIVTMDISDPANPALLDSVKPSGHSYIGGFYGRYAYLQSPLRTYDVTSNPADIQRLGSFTTPASEYMSFGDGYLFLGGLRGGSQGIWKYDISDPNDLALIGRIPGRDSAWDDQFSVPIGNLIAISDDQNVNGFVGAYLAVHATAPDTVPPAVDYVNPPDGAVDQAPSSRIALSFSDQIEFTSVDSSTLIVRPMGGQALNGKWGLAQTVVSFWPDQPLRADTDYEIVAVAGGISDLVGNGLASEFRSAFRTGAASPPHDSGGIGALTAVETGRNASFSVVSPSASQEYQWDLGDGRQASGASVSHSYDRPGRYTVTLSVAAPGGVDLAVYSATQIVHRPLTANAPATSGTVIVTADQTTVWAVNPDADTVTAVGTGAMAKAFERPVGSAPRTLAAAPDGTIWVVNEGSYNISVLDSRTGAVIDTIGLPYASMPYGIAFAPDGSAAYVTLQALGRLLRIDAVTRTIVQDLAVGPDSSGIVPKLRGIAIDSDSTRVLATRFVSPEQSGEIFDVEIRGSAMHLVRTIPLTIDPGPDTPDTGRGVPNYISSLAISPDGVHARVPSKKDNIERGLARDGQALTHDNTVRTVISRIDLSLGREDLAARVELDDHDMASAVAFSPLGDLLFAAVQGSNLVLVINAYTGTQIAGIPTGLAPQGLTLDDRGRLYVQNFMSRSLSVVDVAALLTAAGSSARSLAEIDLVADEKLSADVLLGKQIFYDASSSRMSLEGYVSCSSCHLDGGQDGRTWDFTDRGAGLRNTISLQGRGGTLLHGPVHWTGDFDEIQDFESDIRFHFGGSGFMDDADFDGGTRSDPLGDAKAGLSVELDALAAYVSSLTDVPPSPWRNSDGTLTAEGEVGRQVFVDEGCDNCHGGAEFTDSALGVLHDVGTIRPTSGERLGQSVTGFDTPTLKGVWATAPYLHDGSATTLAQAIEAHRDVALSASALSALVSYVQQIDDSPGRVKPTPPGPGGGGGPAPPPPDDEEDEEEEEEEEPRPPPPPPPPELSVSPAEASESAGVVAFEVRLSRSTSREVTVDYATADGAGRGGARAGVDYTATAGTLSFAPGSRTEEIRVPVTDDGRYEAEPETFTLTLRRPRNARLAGGGSTLRVTGTIHDDDDGPPMAAFELAGAACDDELCRALTGTPVRFSDTSTGKVLSRQWDFGDGRTSRSLRVDHSWSSPGFYEVTLSVSDGTTSATASRKFLVEASEPAGTCEPDAQTRCLQDSRYAVSVEWRKADGESGRGEVVYEGTNDSGLFRFFSRENWEILIKVLDGCAVNGHVWVYAASTTDLGYTIRVTDTVTGEVKEYRNESGLAAPAITDATAFPRGCNRT
ncbi:MAG: PKD domain-containing protein [Acidobacteria bacterium]|nr:PKD domain-containing protein [Acidobacteriota bacterium]